MYCNACGQAMLAGQSICTHCGKPSGAGAQGAMTALAQVEGRVNLLAYGWWTFAGLEAMMGLGGLIFARIFLGMKIDHGWGGPFWMGQNGPLFLLKLVWVAVAVRVTLAALSGYGLLRKASWGRWVGIVAGIISLLHPILGTAMGIWTLAVLLNRVNADGYDLMAEG